MINNKISGAHVSDTKSLSTIKWTINIVHSNNCSLDSEFFLLSSQPAGKIQIFKLEKAFVGQEELLRIPMKLWEYSRIDRWMRIRNFRLMFAGRNYCSRVVGRLISGEVADSYWRVVLIRMESWLKVLPRPFYKLITVIFS